MVCLILQTGRELNLIIKWGGRKLWFFVPLDPRGLFDCRGGKCGFFLSLSTTQTYNRARETSKKMAYTKLENEKESMGTKTTEKERKK